MSLDKFKEKLYRMIDNYADQIIDLNVEHQLMDMDRLQEVLVLLEADIEEKIHAELARRTKNKQGSPEEHQKIAMRIVREKSLEYVQEKFKPLLDEAKAEAKEKDGKGRRAPEENPPRKR